MGRAVAIARLDLAAEGLRSAASVKRMERRRVGFWRWRSFSKAWTVRARPDLRDEWQTLRDWVHRYNDEGLAGLRDRVGGGRSPKLSQEQRAELPRWSGWPRSGVAQGRWLAPG